MTKRSIPICPEGVPFIWLAALATLVLALLGWSWLAVIGLAATAFCLNFFRDPERVVPSGPGLAVAPADGKIVFAGKAPDPITGEPRYKLSVFMNVFNVHVNRAPVDSTVVAVRYHAGSFFNASLDKASEDNERCVIALEDGEGRSWTMVQIAGLVARRIVCNVSEGDELARGQRFGMILFGSRVDLYLPDEYVSVLRIGDKTLAGHSVAARREAASDG